MNLYRKLSPGGRLSGVPYVYGVSVWAYNTKRVDGGSVEKAGVNALTQNLAVTNARHGIRANAIMPGFIDTPMAVDAPARALGVDREDLAIGQEPADLSR